MRARAHTQRAAIGAAYATALSAEGISATWTRYPKFGMRALVPVVMAGIISIYGLVVGVVVGEKLEASTNGYTLHKCANLRLPARTAHTGARHTSLRACAAVCAVWAPAMRSAYQATMAYAHWANDHKCSLGWC
jgi:ATP synthase proteolipid subunit